MSHSQLYEPYRVQGQTVLITGASAGIGEACAWRFAELGCKLILLARRAERLAALSAALEARYPGLLCHTICMDVRDIEAIKDLPSQLPSAFAEVDILLNNAGLALGVAAVQDNDLEQARTMVETNLMQVIAFTRAFTPGMVARDRGHLINISSIAAHEGYAGGSVYSATKHALRAFTDSARHDLVGTSVRVTAVSPGAVRTEFSIVRFEGDVAKADAVYDGIDPLTAGDIADNVVYAATRPLHVQVCEVVVFANHQCSAKGLARVKKAQS